jgi:hypothetical protein
MIQANMGSQTLLQVGFAQIRPTRTLERRCIWCDSTDHARRSDCPGFKDAMKRGLIVINTDNRIINAKSGQAIYPIFNKEKMKKNLNWLIFRQQRLRTIVSPLEGSGPVYGKLGPERTVLVTTLDFKDDTRTNDIVDIDVYEKQRHDDILRHMRPRSKLNQSTNAFRIGKDFLKVYLRGASAGMEAPYTQDRQTDTHATFEHDPGPIGNVHAPEPFYLMDEHDSSSNGTGRALETLHPAIEHDPGPKGTVHAPITQSVRRNHHSRPLYHDMTTMKEVDPIKTNWRIREIQDTFKTTLRHLITSISTKFRFEIKTI